jgi:hypothetical protein
MYSELSAFATDTGSVVMTGELNVLTFELNFYGTTQSYPADMMVYVYAPDGNCAVWGGWNVTPTGDCNDLGTGNSNSWPSSWSTTVNGLYTHSLDVSEAGLGGAGVWTVVIQNGWSASSQVVYDLQLVFEGPCQGECDNAEACNYVEDAQWGVEEACLYPGDECNDNFTGTYDDALTEDCLCAGVPSLWSWIRFSADHEMFETLVIQSGMEFVLNDLTVNRTLFAPTDSALNAHFQAQNWTFEELQANPQPFADLLLHHLLDFEYPEEMWVDGGYELTMLGSNSALLFEATTDTSGTSWSANGVDFATRDILTVNGWVHVPNAVFETLVVGCADELACNFDPTAALDNGSCFYPGCDDPWACNFDQGAGCNDGSCIYPLVGSDCNAGSVACGNGTAWDAFTQTCFSVPAASAADFDGSGCVQLNDLLFFLTQYGTCQ